MAKAPNKRSLTISGHRTSISLEAPFWDALNELARGQGKSIAGLVSEIDERRAASEDRPSLSAALRLYVLSQMQMRVPPGEAT
ncbi:MAG: ribbon-helix-helix domain-containing protein [Pseudomonadota bacterium]